VLLLPNGGPSWIPLLPIAAAVVVDGGSALSDVAVACRDLDLPCVVATVDATQRIGQGTIVEVDGFAGTVRLPGRRSAGMDEAPTALPRLFDQPRSNPA
jgi:phosphohistidine swiveling domain-containing protein